VVPHTLDFCNHPTIKKNIHQFKIDIKDCAIIYQQMPNITKPGGEVAFQTAIAWGSTAGNRATAVDDVTKLVKDSLGKYIIVEGSYQDLPGPLCFKDADFQGCETDDWAEAIDSRTCEEAFSAMDQFLSSMEGEPLVSELVATLKKELQDWAPISPVQVDASGSK